MNTPSFTGSVSTCKRPIDSESASARCWTRTRASIVELGMVGEITVFERHAVVHASLTTVGCPYEPDRTRRQRGRADLEDVDTIDLVMGVLDAPRRPH